MTFKCPGTSTPLHVITQWRIIFGTSGLDKTVGLHTLSLTDQVLYSAFVPLSNFLFLFLFLFLFVFYCI